MSQQPVPDSLLRQFLLGTISDRERDHIECLFLTDAPTRERILAAEEELMEDYLEGTLDGADLGYFLSQYRTAAQQRKLRILKALKAYALDQVISAGTSVL